MALVLLDVSNLIYRAYYSLNPELFKRSDGKSTNVVYGVANMILKVTADLKKMYNTITIVACIDSPTCTYSRKQEQPQYKQTRTTPPDQLRHQFNWVKQLIECMQIHKCEIPGYEADDIICSYVTKYCNLFEKVVVVSPDKDMYQLITKNVVLYNPRTKTLENEQDVFAKIGVHPTNFTMYQSIIGDKIDNVPGIKGIGPKTAIQLINACNGQFDQLFADTLDHKKKVMIQSNKFQIESNLKVVSLKKDLAVNIPKNTFTTKQLKQQAFTSFLDEMEIKSMNLKKYAL